MLSTLKNTLKVEGEIRVKVYENFALFSVDKFHIKNTLSNYFKMINNNLRDKKVRGDVKFCTFDAFGGMFIQTHKNKYLKKTCHRASPQHLDERREKMEFFQINQPHEQ